LPEEADFQSIFPEPLQIVVEALQAQTKWNEMLCNLPDISVELAKNYALMSNTAIPNSTVLPPQISG
jgi:hypothetical protein